MSIKDILAIVTDAEGDDSTLKAAEGLSARFDAHLSVAFLTALPDEPLAYEPTVVAGIWAELLGRARAEAQGEKAKVERHVQALATPATLLAAEALARDLGRVAAVHARYADLAVVRRSGPDDARELRHDLVEGVLFHAGRPALIVPPDWGSKPIGRRPVLAWDASREATRALADSAALIAGAERMAVITVDAKPRAFGHGDQPGANIAGHLSRRGHVVEVLNVDGMGRTPAQALVDEAQNFKSDLVIMGGYSHARIRELLFGGATRDLLETAPLPILISH
jgi:nucleotide-binding universal stress UspA family protein